MGIIRGKIVGVEIIELVDETKVPDSDANEENSLLSSYGYGGSLIDDYAPLSSSTLGFTSSYDEMPQNLTLSKILIKHSVSSSDESTSSSTAYEFDFAMINKIIEYAGFKRDPLELLKFGSVCRLFNEVSDAEYYWKPLFYKYVLDNRLISNVNKQRLQTQIVLHGVSFMKKQICKAIEEEQRRKQQEKQREEERKQREIKFKQKLKTDFWRSSFPLVLVSILLLFTLQLFAIFLGLRLYLYPYALTKEIPQSFPISVVFAPLYLFCLILLSLIIYYFAKKLYYFYLYLSKVKEKVALTADIMMKLLQRHISKFIHFPILVSFVFLVLLSLIAINVKLELSSLMAFLQQTGLPTYSWSVFFIPVYVILVLAACIILITLPFTFGLITLSPEASGASAGSSTLKNTKFAKHGDYDDGSPYEEVTEFEGEQQETGGVNEFQRPKKKSRRKTEEEDNERIQFNYLIYFLSGCAVFLLLAFVVMMVIHLTIGFLPLIIVFIPLILLEIGAMIIFLCMASPSCHRFLFSLWYQRKFIDIFLVCADLESDDFFGKMAELLSTRIMVRLVSLSGAVGFLVSILLVVGEVLLAVTAYLFDPSATFQTAISLQDYASSKNVMLYIALVTSLPIFLSALLIQILLVTSTICDYHSEQRWTREKLSKFWDS